MDMALIRARVTIVLNYKTVNPRFAITIFTILHCKKSAGEHSPVDDRQAAGGELWDDQDDREKEALSFHHVQSQQI
jgi:hypothetical protein